MNSMAPESQTSHALGLQTTTCIIPDAVGLSWSTDYSLSDQTWVSHLSLVYAMVLLVQLAWACDAANRLQRIVRLLVALSTSAGRARRAERHRQVELVRELRAQMRSVNMTDHFAAYSKLQRKIKEACRQIDKLAPETLQGQVVHGVTIRVALFVSESLLHAWLVSRSPRESVVTRELLDTLTYLVSNAECRSVLTGSPHGVLAWFSSSSVLHSTQVIWWPLLSVFHYLPSKLVTVVWVLLCRQSFTPPLVRLVVRIASLGRTSATSEEAANTQMTVDAD